MKPVTTHFQIQDDVAYIQGELCFQTMSSMMTKPQALIKDHSIHTIDLHAVTKCDTAGLALLIEWRCEANKLGKQIRYVNVSQPILDFAAIHHLTTLLFHHAN